MSGPESELGQLSVAARRGTSRTGLPEPAGTRLGQALARVQRNTPEAVLLARAALAGLHARAGRTPDVPTLPAPQFIPAELPEAAISPALEDLLPMLAQQPEVLREALTLLHPTGRRLNAVQARSLLTLNDGGGDPMHGTLWPVLNEHARWLVRLHPVWKRQDPETLPASVQLARLRRELVEAHAGTPEQTVADLVARWPALKADERRVALGAAASSLHLADWPLLQLAMNDKLPDVRRRALLLQGHLPGEVQEAVRAALPGWFRREKGKLKVVKGPYVEALGQPDLMNRQDHGDSELSRLLGALDGSELLSLLSLDMPELLYAVGMYSEHLGSSLARMRGQQILEDLAQASSGLTLETLLSLNGVLESTLAFWPQRRLQAMLWEAVTRLLGQPELDGPLLRITLSLFAALDESLPLAPDVQAALKKGVLARMVSALGRPQAHDWPTLLNALSERLLLALSREISSYPLPLSPLLAALTIRLDPARPAPTFQEARLSEAVPHGTVRQQEEQNARAIALYSQQVSAHASLTHTLTLRRQVRVALAGEE